MDSRFRGNDPPPKKKISANESKNKDTMVLPLNDRVIEILKRRKKNSHSIYVFPNPNNPEKHIVEIKRLWKVLLQKQELLI